MSYKNFTTLEKWGVFERFLKEFDVLLGGTYSGIIYLHNTKY